MKEKKKRREEKRRIEFETYRLSPQGACDNTERLCAFYPGLLRKAQLMASLSRKGFVFLFN